MEQEYGQLASAGESVRVETKNPAAHGGSRGCFDFVRIGYSAGGRMTASTTWMTPLVVSMSVFTTFAPPT